MSAQANSWDPNGVWATYEPIGQEPWTLRRVVHLHRRAGFAPTWKELQRDLRDGPTKSIDRLLKGQARECVPDVFATVVEQHAMHTSAPSGLQVWWLYRMLAGPDPLGERLTLVWHNHFATSNEKVRDLVAMKRQHELIRKHGRGPFSELLNAVIHDPALLVFLDGAANRKGAPNENLGRELMELFTLGVGNYTEADVKDAARALTGWNVNHGLVREQDSFRNSIPDHDEGEKTILGKTGRWSGDDLVKILLEHPATARRLAWRICDWLMGEMAIDGAAIQTLAAGLRKHDLNIGWAIETVLRSRVFFADANLGNRVLGPVEFVIGMPCALERFDPPPSSLLLAEWTRQLGQDLFYPPNVFGWPGGRAWLTTQGIIGRANYAAALVEGELAVRNVKFDAIALAEAHGRGRDLEDILTFAAELLTGVPPNGKRLKQLVAALGPNAKLEAATARAGFALVAASPEVQMA
jgi:uncharacterized protein (DUF1800 family)